MRITKGYFRQQHFLAGGDTTINKLSWLLYIRDESETVVDPSVASAVLAQREKGALIGSGCVPLTSELSVDIRMPLKNIVLQDDQDLQFERQLEVTRTPSEIQRMRYKFRRL